jgi:uncharacterized repeat protein (TIGR03803 family)
MTTGPLPFSLHSCDKARASLLVVAITCVGLSLATAPATAQTYAVIHNFSSQQSEQPAAGLAIDSSGALYGTTTYTNAGGRDGEAFKMKPHGSSWIFSPFFNFPILGNIDPKSPLLIGPDGALYGTLFYNYGCDFCGAVFRLYPPATAPRTVLPLWNGESLHNFTGGSDGGNPGGALLMDQAGNLYGTTENGGAAGLGAIYQVEHSNGAWNETVIFSPQNEADGVDPLNGVVADSAGNLYGVFQRGGPHGPGAVYELSNSGSGWTEQIVYGFTAGNDGAQPTSVIIDGSGNLYGATTSGGTGHGGTIFKLTHGGGGWTFTTLYNVNGTAPCGVTGRLTLDSAGNLYGTTYCDGAYGYGSIFELTPSLGSYVYTDLHDFTNGDDGSYPNGSLVLDAQGKLYGTTFGGGSTGGGVVFELAP